VAGVSATEQSSFVSPSYRGSTLRMEISRAASSPDALDYLDSGQP